MKMVSKEEQQVEMCEIAAVALLPLYGDHWASQSPQFLIEAKPHAETIFISQLRIATELKHFKHCVQIYRKHPVVFFFF